jgi:D-3-phosphoglycerate dehydrogenase
MAFRIVIPDNIDQKALDILRTEEDIELVVSNMDRAETLRSVQDANGLIIRSATTVDKELFEAAPKLRFVIRAGVGVDNIDLKEATSHGVVVMNTPDGNTISTAEHTFGLMLALARHIPIAHMSMLEGKWLRKEFEGSELRGKTLGIVGFGRIGQALAKRAQAFEMEVVAFDVADMRRPAAQLGVRLVPLDKLYGISDFITLHPVLNETTRGMIDRESIAKMKPGAKLINAARGGLIVDTDLADAIKSGHLAGAALDVFSTEPPIAENPLIGLSGIIHTPHLAASTEDAQITVAMDAAEHALEAVYHGSYRNVVNPAVLKDRTD